MHGCASGSARLTACIVIVGKSTCTPVGPAAPAVGSHTTRRVVTYSVPSGDYQGSAARPGAVWRVRASAGGRERARRSLSVRLARSAPATSAPHLLAAAQGERDSRGLVRERFVRGGVEHEL